MKKTAGLKHAERLIPKLEILSLINKGQILGGVYQAILR